MGELMMFGVGAMSVLLAFWVGVVVGVGAARIQDRDDEA
jgi:hypothetical protein